MKAYQWNAVEYAKHSSIQQVWANELIQKLDLKGNEKILDIGSGDGKITAELALKVPNGFVIGIDNSDEMIQFSQSRFVNSNIRNLEFKKEDARSLSFHNEFDIVFSNATLHWISDHVPVLHGIYKALKQNGKILLQMGGKGNAEDVKKVIGNLIAESEWQEYFVEFNFAYGFYGVEEYKRWLYEVGFDIIRVELFPKIAAHKNRNAFEGWLKTTWLPWMERIPEEKRGKFVARICERYIQEHPPECGGRINVKMCRLEVEANKN